MQTNNEIDIFGEPEKVSLRVFQLAAGLQDSPVLLPHYWRMNVLEQSERHKVADFGAHREFTLLRLPGLRTKPEVLVSTEDVYVSRFRADYGLHVGFPCKWRARQELFPEEGRITFQHIGGITKGMWVEWRIEPREDHVHVTIDHRLTYPIPILGPLFAEFVVGRIFIHNIAGKTLRCFKEKVESEHGS